MAPDPLDAQTLSCTALRDWATASLRAVHAMGVAHGDLALRNFVVPAPQGHERDKDPAAARLALIDFEFATLDPTAEEKEDEMQIVRGLGSGSQTGETTAAPCERQPQQCWATVKQHLTCAGRKSESFLT